MVDHEPRSATNSASDVLVAVPPLASAVSGLAAAAVTAIRLAGIAGPEADDPLATAAIAAGLFALAVALPAGLVAAVQVIIARARRRSGGLPLTAVLLSLLVAVAMGLLAVGVVAESMLRPQPSSLVAYSVPLTRPWTTMRLPIGNGAVLYSDAITLTVHYSRGSLTALTSAYDLAVRSQGWSATFSTSDPGMETRTYVRAGKTLTLAVMAFQGDATVAMTEI